ncbi:ABC transporter substrate-binding protein, partial [Rhizobium ruizarguesonis]
RSCRCPRGSSLPKTSGRAVLFQEKLAVAYQRSLQTIGIAASIRTVDDSQYQSRTNSFDYDMIMKSYTSSLSPGNEQLG